MTTDRLVEAQPAGLSLPGVVTLSPQDGELLDRVRALRDAVATATAVSWQAAPAAHLDTAALHHLPPPWVAGCARPIVASAAAGGDAPGRPRSPASAGSGMSARVRRHGSDKV